MLAEDAYNTPIGNWSEARHFNVSVDLLMAHPSDFVPPANLLDSSLTYVAGSPDGPSNDFALGNLHMLLDENYRFVFAFGVPSSVSGEVRYGIYLDADHQKDSGAALDPQNKPIPVNSLYRPEYALYIHAQQQRHRLFRSVRLERLRLDFVARRTGCDTDRRPPDCAASNRLPHGHRRLQ